MVSKYLKAEDLERLNTKFDGVEVMCNNGKKAEVIAHHKGGPNHWVVLFDDNEAYVVTEDCMRKVPVKYEATIKFMEKMGVIWSARYPEYIGEEKTGHCGYDIPTPIHSCEGDLTDASTFYENLEMFAGKKVKVTVEEVL